MQEKQREKKEKISTDNTYSPFFAASPKRDPRDPPSPIPLRVPCIHPRRPPCRSSCPLVYTCLTFLQTPKTWCHTTLLRLSRYNGRKIRRLSCERERERKREKEKRERIPRKSCKRFFPPKRLDQRSIRSFVRWQRVDAYTEEWERVWDKKNKRKRKKEKMIKPKK